MVHHPEIALNLEKRSIKKKKSKFTLLELRELKSYAVFFMFLVSADFTEVMEEAPYCMTRGPRGDYSHLLLGTT